MLNHTGIITAVFCGAFAVSCFAEVIDLSGTVKGKANNLPISKVSVSLKTQPGISVISDTDGSYRLTGTVNAIIMPKRGETITPGIRCNGNILELSATGIAPVSVELFTATGARVRTLLNNVKLAQGDYTVNLASPGLSAGLYFIRLRQGSISTVCQYVPSGPNHARPGTPKQSSQIGLSKRADAAIDTLVFSCCGFSVGKVAISSYFGTIDAQLTPIFISMVSIPAGTFTMGSNSVADIGAAPPHQVTLAAFTMASTEITQELFMQVMGVNPSHFSGDDSLPVEKTTWFDAILFCNALSRQTGKDTVYSYVGPIESPGNGCQKLTNVAIDYAKHGYRLPTEAEWEYACRAGTTFSYYWGEEKDTSYYWYYSNSDYMSHPVGVKKPNAWGLYDISGNVWEWCNDRYGSYTAEAQTDPCGADTSSCRVVRGGSWYLSCGLDIANHRSAGRANFTPDYYSDDGGFRCVLR
jgi:formylglycine-generating enzyme required for sulfatase activity